MSGKDAEASNGAAGSLVFGVVCALSGAVTAGFGGFGIPVVERLEQLTLLASAWEVAGGATSGLAVRLATTGVFAGAGVLAGGVMAVVANSLRSRKLAVASMVVVTLVSVVQLVGGFLFGSLVTRSFDVLEPNAYSAGFDAEETALIDLSSTLFNKCCRDAFIDDPAIPEVFKSDPQSDILPCPAQEGLDDTDPLVCNEIPESVTSIVGDLGNKLCTCFQQDNFDKLTDFLDDGDKCSLFEAIEVPVGESLEIPVAKITVQFALNSLSLYAPYLPVTNFAMTGAASPRVPAGILNEDGELVPSPPDQGVEGFNCGLGYSKGIAWIQNLYLEELAALPLLLIAVGALQILAVVLMGVFWLVGGGSSEADWIDYNEERVESYKKGGDEETEDLKI
mmetsp:Transcript_5909/g.10562  ORF Transcript_5909/g.10562 Transcript_5909/m.10562 type:complete len:393 (+) Transcript_5909:216-1394(+)